MNIMQVNNTLVLADNDAVASWPLHDWWYLGKGGASYSHWSDWAFMGILYLSIAWFVVLMGLMFYFVVKYRRVEGKPAPVSAAHNSKLEVAWTVIPTLMLVVMFIVGFKGYAEMMVPRTDGMEIDVVAQKWSWTFNYRDGNSSTENLPANELSSQSVPIYYVPESTAVRLKMISKDVMHSFWVPDFRTKIDVMPNRYTTYWFDTAKVPSDAKKLRFPPIEVRGEEPKPNVFAALDGVPYVDHWVFCAEYCGDFHSEMVAVIRVLPKDKYEWWAANASSALPLDQQGQKLYLNNCATCHSIKEGQKLTGPSWYDLYGAKNHALEDGVVDVDDNYIRESILNPGKRYAKGYKGVVMTSFAGSLDERKINAIIAYMKTLSKHATKEGESGKPADKPAESK